MTKKRARCVRTILAASNLLWALPAALQIAHAQDHGDRAVGEQAPNEERGNQDRKQELAEMSRRAQGTKVWQVRGTDKIPAELLPQPVLRFDSQYHRCVDATLWLYSAKGRPVAVQEVECYDRPGCPKHFYCLVSLSDGLINAQWPGEREWSSTKPGVELRALPEAPKAASTESGRMRQMREILRRFTATRVDPGNLREENRALAQPIHRYRDPDSRLQDGAIFVFVANGTSPDFFLLLELRGPDVEHGTWNYGMRRTTTGELHLRLDGKEVWSVPLQSNPGRDVYDTWLFFFENGPPVH